MMEKFNNWEVNPATSGWGNFDLMVGSSVYFMKLFGILPDNPVLAAYAERFLARPAYQKALARDAELSD